MTSDPVKTPQYMLNRDLFVNYYLTNHLPETDAWDEIDESELRDARNRIQELWDSEKSTAPKRNESQLEDKFIRPLFEELGIPFEVEESVQNDQRRPDYAFFRTEKDAEDAFEKREEGGDFYAHAVAVADAKRWGRTLDTSGEKREDYANPSFQIDQYLRKTETQWGVLTTGEKWRLYYKPTSHQLDSYYEIDLPEILENGDLEDFKYFYLFFRHEAFLPDATGDTFLDDVRSESNLFARALGDDLQDNIYEAIKLLVDGFRHHPQNDISEDELDLVHDSSLIYLYRLIFVLYAEAEGRELLDTDNQYYQREFSLNQLKQDVAEAIDANDDERYPVWDDKLWHRINDLFDLINQGSKAQRIPEDDLYIPAYNGELFRTEPEEGDSPEAHFLADTPLSDAHLAEVIDLLTRRKEGGERVYVDYSSLNIRHLGSIYEGLLEYQLNIADQPLTIEDGEYIPAAENDNIVVKADDVYLTTDSGERKATGSYYTPEYVVEYIVENSLGPLVEDIREDLVGTDTYSESGFAGEFAERVFELRVLDPAMGSGHFLTNAVNYLAREIINAQSRQIEQQGTDSIEEKRDIYWARRQVAQRCIYGVDLNPLATELAKVSLWLQTLAAEQPLAFLDHHLKTGNSLVGSDIEDVLGNGGDDKTENGQLTLQESFEHTRQKALEHVTDRFQDLLDIENETIEDIKEMEDLFNEVQEDPLYQHLLAMANVHTANSFGLNVPGDAYERMAEALRDDSWEDIEGQDWFRSSQVIAEEARFFHWELEFPVAFYDDNGERYENAGFDAVIGNPPYVGTKMLDEDLKQYLNLNYSSTTGRWDLYLLFTEKCISLTTKELSFIQPMMFMRREYGKGLREYISSEATVTEVIDLSEVDVFEGATNYPCIITLSRGALKDDSFPIYTPISDVSLGLNPEGMDCYYLENADLGSNPWEVIPPNVVRIMKKIPEEFSSLGEVTESISEGVHTGYNEAFFLPETQAIDKNLEPSLLKPMLKGKDVKRYAHLETQRRCIYPYDSHGKVISSDTLASQYPNIWSHLQSHQDDLEGRQYVIDSGKEWYEIWCERRPEIYSNPKLLTPDIASGNTFSIDTGETEHYFNTKVKSIKLEANRNESDYYALLGVLNSKLLEYLYRGIAPPKRGGYRSYKPGFLSQLPIPNDDLEEIAQHARSIVDAERKHSQLNLQLLEYLGNYDQGPKLPDIGLYQPKNTERLDATTEHYEKLRIGEVRTQHDDSTVTIYATARYKPDNEDEHETDRWGYTESEYLEAFTLANLSKIEAELVQEFVPIVIDQGEGFAGFRENATKSTSLLDRIKSITLPDLQDVGDDLRRYIETKERAQELEGEIESRDQIIDEIVFELYGLTQDEINIVEDSIQSR